jgi:hypothetical protein
VSTRLNFLIERAVSITPATKLRKNTVAAMEHEGQKYSFSEKVAIVVAPVVNFAATFPTVKQYFVTATVGFFAVGILNIVQLDTVSKKLCEIRPGFVWAHGTDGYNWDDSWYNDGFDEKI